MKEIEGWDLIMWLSIAVLFFCIGASYEVSVAEKNIENLGVQKRSLEMQAEMLGYAKRNSKGEWGWIIPNKEKDDDDR